MRRSPAALAFFVAVLTLLSGGAVAYAALGKTVTVSVDGQQRQIHTFAGDVAGVLDRSGVEVGPHDLVVPDEHAAIKDGGRVVVRHARELALTVNGKERKVWVTAASVDDALGELGLRESGEFISASRSLTIPRKGLSLTVRTPQHPTILVDGHTLQPTTTARSVDDLLRWQLHLDLAPSDLVSVPSWTYPTDGLVVTVTRIRDRRVLESVALPFGTETRYDSSMYRDQKKVLQEGRPGVRTLDYIYTMRDGKPWKKKLMNSVVTQAPVTRVVVVGTKVRPAAPQHAPSADGLNWGALAQCESGGNPRAVSPGGTYRGLYQFSLGTWHGVGGAGDPIDASSGEQTYRAQILYSRSGDSPWPVCGHYLYS